MVKNLAYLENLSIDELQKSYKIMTSYPKEQQEEVLVCYARDKLNKFEEINKKYARELGLSDNSPFKRPTDHQNPTDLGKLEELKRTPRNMDSDIAQKAFGKPPLLRKGKWKDTMQDALLMYGYLVQANNRLYEPANGTHLSAVFIVSDDPQYACDIPFLTVMAEKVTELKNSSEIPSDCKEFISVLRDDTSIFNFPLSSSITGGISVWCFTFLFDKQLQLPSACLPTNRIVPFFKIENFKKQKMPQLKLIDGELYKL